MLVVGSDNDDEDDVGFNDDFFRGGIEKGGEFNSNRERIRSLPNKRL